MGAGQILPLPPPLPPRRGRGSKGIQISQNGAKGNKRVAEKRSDPQVGHPAYLPAPMLNGEPLFANASIHNFQGGVAGYVANAVEQALLLPEDMAEL